MTNKKDNNTKKVEGEKSEKSENVVLHVDKDGADEIKKLKATLRPKRVQLRDILISSKSKLQHLQQPLMFITKTTLLPPKLP